MKRYLLFSGFNYESIGGFNEFDSQSDDLDQLKAQGDDFYKNSNAWYHIVDTERMEIIIDNGT